VVSTCVALMLIGFEVFFEFIDVDTEWEMGIEKRVEVKGETARKEILIGRSMRLVNHLQS
jgi:hypothetical protein